MYVGIPHIDRTPTVASLLSKQAHQRLLLSASFLLKWTCSHICVWLKGVLNFVRVAH